MPFRRATCPPCRTILRQLTSGVLRFCGFRDHVHFILRICSPLRAQSEKNEVAPEPVRVSGGSERYEHPPSELSVSSHNPKPRRAADRGSASLRSDIENASGAQTPYWKTPLWYHHAAPGNCANSPRHHRTYSGPALSGVFVPAAERLSRERAILGSRKAW